MNRFKAIFYILSAITSIILVVYAINVYPIAGTDSMVFIPPALLYAKGQGLANPLYYVTQFTDPTHTNRFNYYVPFYSWFLGMLSKVKPSIPTVFAFASLFSITNILLYAKTVSSFIDRPLSVGLKALVLLSVTYVATYLFPTVGRPEGITTLLVFGIYLLYRNRQGINPVVYNIAVCGLFGLMLLSQLICFYFCFLFFVTYELFYTTNIFKTIWVNTLRFAAILGLFCALLAISPNGLANTITGIKLHVSFVFERNSGGLPLYLLFWVWAPLNFGFILVFLLAAAFYIRDIAARFRQIPPVQAVLLAGVQLFIIYGFAKFILYAAPTIYNATTFIMPLTAYLVYNIIRLSPVRARNGATAMLMAAYVGGSLLFLRSLVLFIDYKQDGKDYAAARAIANNIANNNHNVYTTLSLWPLFDNLDSVHFFNENIMHKDDIIIVQQAYHAMPEVMKGKYTVMYDFTTAEKRKFLGITLTNRPQGYSFMVCKIK